MQADSSSPNAHDPAIALLWPGAEGSQSKTEAYQAIPSRENVRLLVPSSARAVAVAALAALRDSSTERARRRTRLMAAAWGRGWTPGQPVNVPAGGISTELSDLFGIDVVCGVHLGPPRANRKPVLVVLSPTGEVLGFAKVGAGPLTDRLVSNEAFALGRIQGLGALRAPSLIANQVWTGHPLVVQSALDKSNPTPGSKLDSVTRAQVELSQSEPGTFDTYKEALLERVSVLTDEPDATRREVVRRLGVLVEHTVADPQTERIAVGPWHGDWRATNMLVSESAVNVWDWERFDPCVPHGFDALHYFLTSHAPSEPELARLVPAVLQTAEATLAPFDVPRPAAELVATLYLLELATRYVADKQEQTSARLGDVSRWLIPSLESHVSRV